MDAKFCRSPASHVAHGGPDTFWSFKYASLSMNRAPRIVRDNYNGSSLLSVEIRQEGQCYSLHLPEATKQLIHLMTLDHGKSNPDRPSPFLLQAHVVPPISRQTNNFRTGSHYSVVLVGTACVRPLLVLGMYVILSKHSPS